MIIENVKTNIVPSLTWNWLKSNNDVISISQEFSDFCENDGEYEQNVSCFSINNLDDDSCAFPSDYPQELSGVFNRANPKPADSRCENYEIKEIKTDVIKSVHPVEKLINETVKNQKVIKINGVAEKPFVVNFNFEKCGACKYKIHALAGACATVIFVYKGKCDSLIKTELYIEENADIRFVKVQLLEEDCLNIDDTAVFQKDNSKVHFIQIELGGKHINSGLHVRLEGNYSKFFSNVAYLCKNEQILDMNHIVDQYGKKSECKMSVQGSLDNASVKIYRGTIDLKKGCCGAKGNEMEETILLSPKSVNKSLPVILCDEEDVEGEHGATIGKLSGEMLFYMQTRGISEGTAKTLLSRAKIQAAADLIPDENVKNEINCFLQ